MESGPQFGDDVEAAMSLSTASMNNPLLFNRDEVWDEMNRLIDTIGGNPSYYQTLFGPHLQDEEVKTQLRALIAIGKTQEDVAPASVEWYDSLKDTAVKAAASIALLMILVLYTGYRRANHNVKLSTKLLEVQTAQLKALHHDTAQQRQALHAYLAEFQESRRTQDRNFFDLIEAKLFSEN
jgi:hypothetical protein